MIPARRALFSTLFLLCWILHFRTDSVQSAPIRVTRETFDRCQPGNWAGIPAFCCPPKVTNETIVDFSPPKRDPSKPLRVRKALQCLKGKELREYTVKLQKGYELMRALPDSDPRSFKRQYEIHCAYATGSFVQEGSTNLTIDIHLGWYFHPWHRAYVYFHERILQWLLQDPEFTLHYWNYDNSAIMTGQENDKSDVCCVLGHFMPPMYSDPTKATFQFNRSYRAFSPGRPVDLGFDATFYNPALGAPNSTYFPDNLTLEQAVWRNQEIMHKSFITWGNNARDFLGKPYRAGNPRTVILLDGPGTQERFPHSSLHCWVGGKMFEPKSSPEDSVFFAFHANLERLWDLWLTLNETNKNPTDTGWLNGEFLFWDENAVLNRFKVQDFVAPERLGYTYQKANDAVWINFDLSTPYPEAKKPHPASVGG